MSLECRRDVGNIQRNDLSVNSRYMANVLSIHDQGNGSVENIVQENIPSVDGTLSTPLIPSHVHFLDALKVVYVLIGTKVVPISYSPVLD